MGQLQSLVSGALSYLVFTGIGGFVGYFFAKKHTEHEVGYRRRVEVVERIQSLVASLAEGFEAALGYIREPGPAGGLPAKEIEGSIDELERYYVEQEIWLDGETLARLDTLVTQSRAHRLDLARLPRRYGDPNFEREYARVGAALGVWVRRGLPEAREGLADAFRAMLGVGGGCYGIPRQPRRIASGNP